MKVLRQGGSSGQLAREELIHSFIMEKQSYCEDGSNKADRDATWFEAFVIMKCLKATGIQAAAPFFPFIL